MDNFELEKAITQDKIISPYFKGVLAADELMPPSQPLTTDNYYILNLDPSWEKGSHWVVVKLCPERKNEYFDSYGWDPPYKHFIDILGNNYIKNNKQLQHPFTTVCGQHCLFYIWNRCRIGLTLEEHIKLFSQKDQWYNDQGVNEMSRILFNTNLQTVDVDFLKNQICSSLYDNKKYCIKDPDNLIDLCNKRKLSCDSPNQPSQEN